MERAAAPAAVQPWHLFVDVRGGTDVSGVSSDRLDLVLTSGAGESTEATLIEFGVHDGCEVDPQILNRAQRGELMQLAAERLAALLACAAEHAREFTLKYASSGESALARVQCVAALYSAVTGSLIATAGPYTSEEAVVAVAALRSEDTPPEEQVREVVDVWAMIGLEMDASLPPRPPRYYYDYDEDLELCLMEKEWSDGDGTFTSDDDASASDESAIVSDGDAMPAISRLRKDAEQPLMRPFRCRVHLSHGARSAAPAAAATAPAAAAEASVARAVAMTIEMPSAGGCCSEESNTPTDDPLVVELGAMCSDVAPV